MGKGRLTDHLGLGIARKDTNGYGSDTILTAGLRFNVSVGLLDVRFLA